MATVVIPDPNVHALNVRGAPGGKVLGTVREGDSVSVVGECASAPAAGLGKAQPGTPAPATGWCQIDAPMQGWVSAKYLAFGAAALAAAQPGSKAVPPPPAPIGFAGAWKAQTDDGTPYEITLTLHGNAITGRYQGGDGSVGQLGGSVKGAVFSFSWKQTDGQSGFGRFQLSQDGQSFQGSYSMRATPKKVAGTWNGVRP